MGEQEVTSLFASESSDNIGPVIGNFLMAITSSLDLNSLRMVMADVVSFPFS